MRTDQRLIRRRREDIDDTDTETSVSVIVSVIATGTEIVIETRRDGRVAGRGDTMTKMTDGADIIAGIVRVALLAAVHHHHRHHEGHTVHLHLIDESGPFHHVNGIETGTGRDPRIDAVKKKSLQGDIPAVIEVTGLLARAGPSRRSIKAVLPSHRLLI